MINLTRNETRKILDAALARGGAFADIFFEDARRTEVTLDAGRMERVTTGRSGGASLRVEEGGTLYFASTNDVSPDSLSALARQVAESVGGKRKISCLPFERRDLPVRSPVEILPTTVSLETKADAVREAEKGAKERDARVMQVRAACLDAEQDILVANSRGVWDTEKRVRLMMYAMAIARDGGKLFTGFQSSGGSVGYEHLRRVSPYDVGRDAARIAVLQLEGVAAPAGEMAVVVGASAGGTLIHEACGHGLEGDLVMSGVSVYAGEKEPTGRVGTRVASPLVTVVDDGTVANARGTDRMDDEGSPSERVVLIENGVLRGFLQSLQSAEKLGMPPTGNGRREGFRKLPIPRMRNTYVLPGKTHPQDIVASVAEGLYVAKMGGGQVDVASGHFVFHISEGYLIRDGKLGKPVRGATLTGCGPDVLSSIDMVGNDFGVGLGTCGKDGQWVPVSNGQPTIRIPKIVVGGIA